MARLLREDMSAILLPCWGFDHEEDAIEHTFDQPADSFDIVRSEKGKCYLPRINYNDMFWDHNAHLISASVNAHRPPLWHVLQRVTNPRPEGAYNVILVVEGKRRFHRTQYHAQLHSQIWRELSEGWKDCYAAWLRGDNRTLGSCMRGDSTTVYSTRNVRGVIFAREAIFSDDGYLIGHDWIAVFISASVLDKDPRKDDLLRIETDRRHLHRLTGDHDPTIEELMNDVEPKWHPALLRAYQGFNKHCRPISPARNKLRMRRLQDQRRAQPLHVGQ